MNKEVVVAITGSQLALGQEGPVEMIAKGNYYRRNNKTYVKYKEVEPDGFTSECMIKIYDETIELTKKGAYSSCLLFCKDKSTMTPLVTPFGNLMVSVMTKEMIVLEDKDILIVKIKYSLDINYEYVSDCDVEIKIASA